MHTNKKNPGIIKVLIALTLCFIWGNSLMPASVSGAISGWVKDVLNAILGGASIQGVPGDGLLRKIAHASEFAVLGMVLALLKKKGNKTKVSLLAICGLGAAFVDETIQLFVVGRSGQIKDAWIDIAGFGIGVLLVSLIASIVQKRKMKTIYKQ